MKLTEILLLTFGALSAFFGLIMVLGGLMTVPDDAGLVAHIAFVLALGVFPLALGVGLGVYVWRRAARRRREALERSILGLARDGGGKITAQEVASATDLTLDEAKAKLDQLHLSGHCQMDFDATGTVVYSFLSRTS